MEAARAAIPIALGDSADRDGQFPRGEVVSGRTKRNTSSQARQNRLYSECRSKAGKAPTDRTISRRPNRAAMSFGIARRKSLRPADANACHTPYPFPAGVASPGGDRI